MKRLNMFLVVLLLFAFFTQVQARKKSSFEIYGDIFQYLPAMAATYSLIRQDYKGLGQLAIGTGSTLALTYAIKYSFIGISRSRPNWAKISQRPENGSYDGFPSGHSSSAFSAAGFMQRRYGWKYGVPTTILATLVGISRITAKRHTITQVVAGSLLGYGFSYLFSSRFENNFSVNISIDEEEISKGAYQNIYAISVGYRF